MIRDDNPLDEHILRNLESDLTEELKTLISEAFDNHFEIATAIGEYLECQRLCSDYQVGCSEEDESMLEKLSQFNICLQNSIYEPETNSCTDDLAEFLFVHEVYSQGILTAVMNQFKWK